MTEKANRELLLPETHANKPVTYQRTLWWSYRASYRHVIVTADWKYCKAYCVAGLQCKSVSAHRAKHNVGAAWARR